MSARRFKHRDAWNVGEGCRPFFARMVVGRPPEAELGSG